MDSIVVLGALALALGVVGPIVGRYAAGKLHLHASGDRAALEEFRREHNGTMSSGGFVDPYPAVSFHTAMGRPSRVVGGAHARRAGSPSPVDYNRFEAVERVVAARRRARPRRSLRRIAER